jgi:glycosyltransferase involved in cell wall biosynthesis
VLHCEAAIQQINCQKLVLVGKCAWLYDETLRALDQTGVKDAVVLTGYVPETDLPALYSGNAYRNSRH